MTEATIITDGSANNIKGDGGWCAIIKVDSKLIELSGWEESTTSNRMELLAAIEGLRYLSEPHEVTLISDSSYMLNTLKQQWYLRWFEEENRPRPNIDLWHILVGLINFHNVTFKKVKGHSGDYWNSRADALAGNARVSKAFTTVIQENYQEGTKCDSITVSGKGCVLDLNHLGKHYYSDKVLKV